MEEKERISLETEDRDFDELLIQEYPGRLFERNRKVRQKGSKRIFCYYGLEKSKFNELLSKYKGKHSYKTHRFLGFPNDTDEMGVSLN